MSLVKILTQGYISIGFERERKRERERERERGREREREREKQPGIEPTT